MQKEFKWLPQHDVGIKKNWNVKASEVLRHTMHNVRQDLFKKKRIGQIGFPLM